MKNKLFSCIALFASLLVGAGCVYAWFLIKDGNNIGGLDVGAEGNDIRVESVSCHPVTGQQGDRMVFSALSAIQTLPELGDFLGSGMTAAVLKVTVRRQDAAKSGAYRLELSHETPAAEVVPTEPGGVSNRYLSNFIRVLTASGVTEAGADSSLLPGSQTYRFFETAGAQKSPSLRLPDLPAAHTELQDIYCVLDYDTELVYDLLRRLLEAHLTVDETLILAADLKLTVTFVPSPEGEG